jgi:HEAT repeat protein
MRTCTTVALGLLAALLACGRSGDLGSPDPARRAEAVRAAASKGADGTATLLVAQRDGDPRVRRAVAEALASREGPAAVDALAVSLADPDPEVVVIAAKGLAGRPSAPRTRGALVAAYAGASPEGRAAIADALHALGTSLRDAVELEARSLWERNVAALAAPGPARVGAAEELGASARTEAVQRLLPLVDPNRNTDRELLAAAARGLGEAGDRAARKHLEVLLEERDGELAEAAADALGRLGDPGAADALATSAAQGGGRISAAALEALLVLPQAPEVGTSLCEVALRALDPKVSARAARAARERDAECPLKPAYARIGKPGTPAALAALAELHPAEAEVVPKLVALLDPARTPDPEVRIAAYRALARVKAASAGVAVRYRAVALQARVEAARARWVRGRLAAAPLPGLEGKGEERLAAVLARAPGAAAGGDGQEPDLAPWVRLARGELDELGVALATAGRLKAPGADKLLLPAVADPDPAVRAGAVEGLGVLGGDRALEVAAGAIADPDPRVFAAAAGGLRGLGPRGAAALIRAMGAKDLDPDRCGILARALGEAGVAEAVPALAGRLDGPCAPDAAQALGRIAAPSAAAPLAAALARPGGPGRVEMVEALGAVGGSAGAEALTRELTSDRPQVRAAAARALAVLRHEPAAERLEALRSDYYGLVRRAAVEALAKLPTGPARR